MKKEEKIYDLKPHETMYIGHVNIMSVPGGWIYTESYRDDNGIAISKCFVPFDNEFSKQKPIKPVKPNKEIKT